MSQTTAIRSLVLATLLLASACTGGGRGPAGDEGPDGPGAAPCTATTGGAQWTITCPDGSSAELEPSRCEELDGVAGGRIIRCDDGTEATVLGDDEALGAASIIGVVAFEDGSPAAGAQITVGGTWTTGAGSDGSFRLERIPAGIHDVRISLPPSRPVTLEGLRILEGVLDLGKVELELVRTVAIFDFDMLSDVLSIDGSHLLIPSMSGAAQVLDLATGEELAIDRPSGVGIYGWRWLETNVLALFGGRADQVWLGIWSSEGTVHWYPDLEGIWTSARGSLATRRDEGGGVVYYFLRDGEEQALDVREFTSTAFQLANQPRWLLTSLQGTILIDGTGEAPIVKILEPRNFASFAPDPTGDLVWLRFEGAQVLHDLSRGTVVATEGSWFSSPDLPGMAIWTDSSDERTFRYDVLTGLTSSWPVEARLGWTFHLGWFWEETPDGDLVVSSRDGKISHTLGSASSPFDFYFSPAETKLALYQSGLLRMLDLETGDWSEHALDLDDWEWVGEDGIVGEGPEGLLLLGFDGSIDDLGLAYGWTVQDGWLFFSQRGRANVTKAGVGAIELGPAMWAEIAPGGGYAAWLSPAGGLYFKNLVTNEVRRIAQSVDRIRILPSGVLFESGDDLLLGSIGFAPYR